MIAVDTCVIVRWLLRDDPQQAAAADVLLAEPFFLGVSVVVELGWVLRTVGKMDRDKMSRALGSLLGLPTACVEHDAHVRWAVERFATRGDFADLIHIAASTEADAFATFDKGLLRDAGPNAPLSVAIVGH